MTAREEKQVGAARSGVERHEQFLELCALATSGSLSAEEKKKLQDHLAVCPACQEAMNDFEAVVDTAVPSLARELAGEPAEEDTSFSIERAEQALRKRLTEEDRTKKSGGMPFRSGLAIKDRTFFRRLDRVHFWLPLAAGAVLCVTLGIMAYRMGLHRGVEVARLEPGNNHDDSATYGRLAAAVRERDLANARLAERDKSIADLRGQIASQSAEIARLKTAQSEQDSARQTNEEAKQHLAEESDRLAAELSTAQTALQASEKKLNSLDQERAGDMLRAAGLEAKVAELSRKVDDQARNADEQQELLSHDRDIRELMGARDLYVAEVYDIARTGEKQKAFGRVFYTKGKSLIFYAYDLDAEPQWKDADAFQAWGAHGPDRSQAFNLGMFYEDNVSKKRWVLKYDDRKTLQQIDAVFVTIEPHGGSEKPSGKPFLYAYLKMSANHP
jgi:predicted  nucleic acid-binding Zn-ribbon protein